MSAIYKQTGKRKRIPERLQAVLWSANIHHLDIERDKGYIVHQVFAYGRMEDILWLLQAYTRYNLRKVFTTIPYKDYDRARFYFIKDFILDLEAAHLDERLYVRDIPRNIGQRQTQGV